MKTFEEFITEKTAPVDAKIPKPNDNLEADLKDAMKYPWIIGPKG